MITVDQIRALHIELTTKCNARCPMCMRNYRGYEFNSGYPLTELSLDQIKKIFDVDFLKQIDRINFNGNLGDFSLAQDAIEIVDYFLKNTSAHIQIETNGSTRNPSWWAQLSNPRIQILFALDGLADTHALYRQDTDWNKIIRNAQAVIANGGIAIWKFIPFAHNRHQQEICKQMAHDMGFRHFLMYDQGRNQGPVFSKSGDFSHWLGDADDSVPDIHGMIEHHITWFDHKKKIDWVVDTAEISCRHIQRQEIYLAANGTVYPCCFLGFYPSSMKQPGNSQIIDLVAYNDALEYPLSKCLEWFDLVEKSWSQPSIAQGRLYNCVVNCGK
jgi:sulfatase maturation enzyme AslB (radical SAM superfamily)